MPRGGINTDEVQCLKYRLAHSFGLKKSDSFWSSVKHLNNARKHACTPVVNGSSNRKVIANVFAFKFGSVLNKHSTSSRNSFLAVFLE